MAVGAGLRAWVRRGAEAIGRATVRAYASYDAASQSRRTVGWNAPTASPNTAVLYNLATLRDRSRSATRNNGYGKGVIDKLVTNIIGTGVKPLSKADDPELRRQIQALWLDWTDESDADGLLDWCGQQAQAARAWLEGGEVFVRMRPRLPSDGLSVPLQIQVIEPELCPHTYNTTLSTGNRVRAGIEFNPIGKRVAYWFYPSRPGDLIEIDTSELRRIPADQVQHLFDPLRPGQLRGIPHLTPALIRLHELDKFDDATLLRQQLQNLFAAFIRRPATLGDDATHPLTGLPTETSTDGKPMLTMEPGIIQELSPGEEIDFSEPPDAGQGYKDFTRQQLYHVAAATGVPYETLTGDLSNVNDRTVRVVLQEFRRRVQMAQHQIVVFQLCRPVWLAWFDRVFLSGALPIPIDYVENPAKYTRAEWMPQRWPYIHPVQDIQAEKDEIRAGFTSRSTVVSEHGEDSEAIDDQQSVDNARADKLGLKYDSDGRQSPKASAAPATDTSAGRESNDDRAPAAKEYS